MNENIHGKRITLTMLGTPLRRLREGAEGQALCWSADGLLTVLWDTGRLKPLRAALDPDKDAWELGEANPVLAGTYFREQMEAVLGFAHKFNVSTNPEPLALFDPAITAMHVWCTPSDCPPAWSVIPMSQGNFAKPCACVGSLFWRWGEMVSDFQLKTYSSELQLMGVREVALNHPDDVAWARVKLKTLFSWAGLNLPEIEVVERVT